MRVSTQSSTSFLWTERGKAEGVVMEDGTNIWHTCSEACLYILTVKEIQKRSPYLLLKNFNQ
jgi:hypothetical protein